MTLDHVVGAAPLAATTGRAWLQSGSAVADVYPFKRGFHLSAGVRFYGNRARAMARATPGTTYTVGGKTYSAAQIRLPGATGSLAAVTPMVMAGYAARLSGRIAFGIEAGALLRGNMERAGRTICTGATCHMTMEMLEAERAGLGRDISRLKAYPLAQVKFGLRF